jgi:hypothetical protein
MNTKGSRLAELEEQISLGVLANAKRTAAIRAVITVLRIDPGQRFELLTATQGRKQVVRDTFTNYFHAFPPGNGRLSAKR